jgi:Killing trait
MANETVNQQVVDAVTATNLKVVGEAPAQAIATLYQIATQAAAIAMGNANSNQGNMNALNPSIVAKAISIIAGA